MTNILRQYPVTVVQSVFSEPWDVEKNNKQHKFKTELCQCYTDQTNANIKIKNKSKIHSIKQGISIILCQKAPCNVN